MRALITIGLLILSNVFMTLAWYGHIGLSQNERFKNLPLVLVIGVSWGLAFFEYCAQIPANKLGHQSNGGPFSIWELKVLQEVISLIVFTLFVVMVFKSEPLKWNHALGFFFLVLAVYFIFKK